MPLLDHFRPPIQTHHHWESFHSNWATRLADDLSDRLPSGFLAEEHTYAGNQTEIDIAAFEVSDAGPAPGNGVALAQPKLFRPAAAATTIPAVFPDVFEVRIYRKSGGLTLVGVIELISPGNKDRPEQRAAFATKIAGLLHQAVSVVIVDVVTSRKANLHHEIMKLLNDPPTARFASSDLYAVAYRPVLRNDAAEIDIWHTPLTVGSALPVMPLRLTGELFVPVDLESTYQEACRRRNLGT